MIVVKQMQDDRVVREWVFSRFPITIGRDEKSDILLLDDSVSSRHAVIEPKDNQLVIRDLESRNGIRLNNQQLTEAPIHESVRVFIGLVELSIQSVARRVTRELRPEDWRQANRRRSVPHYLAYLAFGVLGLLISNFLDADRWSPATTDRTSHAIRLALSAAALLPILALLLLGIFRVAGRRIRFADTLQRLAIVAWVFVPLILTEHLQYYLPVGPVMIAVEHLSNASALCFAVLFLVSTRKPTLRPTFIASWLAISMTLYISLVSVNWDDDDEIKWIGPSRTQARPPLAGYPGASDSPATYFTALRDLAPK